VIVERVEGTNTQIFPNINHIFAQDSASFKKSVS